MIDPTGEIYGGLVVLGLSENRYRAGGRLVEVLCNCGVRRETRYSALKSGYAKSCGCQERPVKHGESKTPLYVVWAGMKARCYNPNHAAYRSYGGRGIQVSAEWHSFEAFYRDMAGTYQKGLCLDRVDNSKGYGEGNCNWVTPAQNNRNTRRNINVIVNGLKYCLKDVVKKFSSVPYNTIKDRLARGVPILEALPNLKGMNVEY